MKKKILLVDDEKEMLNSVVKILNHREDFILKAIDDPEKAFDLVKSESFDMIISDLKMGRFDGISLIKKALNYKSDTIGIIITGYATIETSVRALQEGVVDFVEKPFNSTKLFEVIDRSFEKYSINHDIDNIFQGIIYESSAMKNVINMIKKIARQDLNILVLGESGTGKEVISRAIHNVAKGLSQPFVPVNCGALPENLFESELFGHEKGSFTGAQSTKPGLIEFANKGTFFFDEIGDMSQSIQVKLLRMLETKKIRRVGGKKEIDVDVRVIAATNKNLIEEVEKGNFREDLYYRLNTFSIEIPPLRERTEDIIPLARHFLKDICCKINNVEKRFTENAENALLEHNWPGNIRELQNIINRAYYLSSSNKISADSLPFAGNRKLLNINNNIKELNYKDAKEKVLEKFEKEYLTYHLKRNLGNISKTADSCGLDRRTIYRLLRKNGIEH